MGADELSAMLWRERRQLELLLFRLETQLLHVRAGNWHWLKFTATEVERVLEHLRFDTLSRNIESSAVALEWRLPANATLPVIASVAPPGIWPELLQEHRHAMVLLLRQVEYTVAANVEALLSGPIAAEDVRLTAGQSGDVLGPEASAAAADAAEASASEAAEASASEAAADPSNPADDLVLLTENANIERALAVTRDCSLPLLEEFLGLA